MGTLSGDQATQVPQGGTQGSGTLSRLALSPGFTGSDAPSETYGVEATASTNRRIGVVDLEGQNQATGGLFGRSSYPLLLPVRTTSPTSNFGYILVI